MYYGNNKCIKEAAEAAEAAKSAKVWKFVVQHCIVHRSTTRTRNEQTFFAALPSPKLNNSQSVGANPKQKFCRIFVVIFASMSRQKLQNYGIRVCCQLIFAIVLCNASYLLASFYDTYFYNSLLWKIQRKGVQSHKFNRCLFSIIHCFKQDYSFSCIQCISEPCEYMLTYILLKSIRYSYKARDCCNNSLGSFEIFTLTYTQF